MGRFIAALVTVTLLVVLPSHTLDAQQREAEPFAAGGIPAVSFPDPPVEYGTAEGQPIRERRHHGADLPLGFRLSA